MTTPNLLALLIGIVAGMRAMTAPAMVSWAACYGRLNLAGGELSIFGYFLTPWIFGGLACGELVIDKLPTTPSRLELKPLFVRLGCGGLSGAAIGSAAGELITGLGLGVVGAWIGTLSGAQARGGLAAAFGRDWPAAVFEDVLAISLALVVISFSP